VSFKPGPEDCYGKYESDNIWQTVSDACSGDCVPPFVICHNILLYFAKQNFNAASYVIPEIKMRQFKNK